MPTEHGCPRCGSAVATETCPACGRPSAVTLRPSDDPQATSVQESPLPPSDDAFRTSAHTPIAPPGDDPQGTYPPAHREARIGRFEVRVKLGEGAFGEVFRAYDPLLDREVALKVAKPGVVGTPQRARRFLREAKAAANLRHPHIVPVYDTGADDDRYYIAGAFIDGKALADTIGKGGEDFRRAARLARELAEALAYAHEQGIVHRDVKPANVMVDRADRVHLMDFGLAARAEAGSKLTSDGAVLGTPAYMAPEQASGQNGEARPAADQYSCGVVLYELLTGRVPFSGAIPAVIHNHIHTEPERPSRLRSPVPRDLETICLKAMAKRPADRYADCGALADDLRRWLDGEAITARRLGPVERLSRWVRKNPAVAGLAGALAVALVAGTGVSVALAVNAREQAGRANQAAQDAQTEQRRASEAREDAVRNAAAADANAEEAVRRLYVSDMRLAARAWNESQTDLLLALLDRQRPERTRGKDLRDFEWQYWWRRTHRERFNLHGHAGALRSVATGPDGRLIATGGEDGGVRLWEVDTAKEVGAIPVNRGWVNAIAFSPDGTRVAIAAGDYSHVGGLSVREVSTGREVWAVEPSTRWFTAVAFNPDGSHLAVGTTDGMFRVLDAKTGAGVWGGGKQVGTVQQVAYSRDGQRLVVAAGDYLGAGEVTVWEPTAGKQRTRLGTHPKWVTGVAFSPDGLRLASSSGDGIVRVWDAEGRPVMTCEGHREAAGIAFSRDGRRLASAGREGVVILWEAESGREVTRLKGHTGGVNALTYAGEVLVTAAGMVGGAGEAKVWARDIGPDPRVLQGHSTITWGASASRDGTRIATAGQDKRVVVWDASTGQTVRVLSVPAKTDHATFSPDGRHVAAGCQDRTIRVWNVESGELVRTLTGHTDFVWRVAYTPNGQRLASVSWDGTVRLWDAATGAPIAVCEGHNTRVTALAISPDGLTLATGTRFFSKPGELKLWDAATGRYIRDLGGHANGTLGAAFSADGRLATCGADHLARIWNPSSGRELLTLRGHASEVSAVAFNARGTRIVTGGHDRTVRVWSADTGEELLTLSGHTASVQAVGFVGDGNALFSSSNGSGARPGELILWNAD